MAKRVFCGIFAAFFGLNFIFTSTLASLEIDFALPQVGEEISKSVGSKPVKSIADKAPIKSIESANTDSMDLADSIKQDELDDFTEFEQEFAQTDMKIDDPLEGFNRAMLGLNWWLYDYLLSPIADAWGAVVPLGFRMGISNFFNNLLSPLRFLGSLLSGHPQDAMDELGRFVLNSIVGLGGILDIATHDGLYTHDRDFDDVFAAWGISSGYFVVLPFLGPKTFRSTVAILPNSYSRPLKYYDEFGYWGETALQAGNAINSVAQNKRTMDLIRKQGENYEFVRDAFMRTQINKNKSKISEVSE